MRAQLYGRGCCSRDYYLSKFLIPIRLHPETWTWESGSSRWRNVDGSARLGATQKPQERSFSEPAYRDANTASDQSLSGLRPAAV
jgi:hypothetical protein